MSILQDFPSKDKLIIQSKPAPSDEKLGDTKKLAVTCKNINVREKREAGDCFYNTLEF